MMPVEEQREITAATSSIMRAPTPPKQKTVRNVGEGWRARLLVTDKGKTMAILANAISITLVSTFGSWLAGYTPTTKGTKKPG